jgi:hypothetical protein
MSNTLTRCAIPTLWCGKEDEVPKLIKDNKKYTRKGNRYECLQLGIGAGQASEKLKKLPKNSLQRIKYIGDKHEQSFIKNGIKTLTDLKNEMNKANVTPANKEKQLKKILRSKSGSHDGRAFNSVIYYLYQSGVNESRLPKCIHLKST